MRNLQEIIPAFFVGPGGQKLTPEQIAAREEVAKSLMAQATDTSPNAGGWTSVAAKGLMGFSAGRNRNAADRAAKANADANSATSKALLASLGGSMTPSTGGGGWTGMAPTADVAPSSSVASALVQSPQMVENQPPVPGLQAVQMPSILPQSFLAAVDRTEGAGGYDTLFGHAQKGAFAGTDISRMPIRDVIAFTDPSGPYAQSVKSQIGRVATPVGRYQVVGTTLRNAVGALGLDPNQPFDPATQDRVAAYLATNRIKSAGSLPAQISALRSEWEGFKNVPDDQMAQIIGDLQNVDPMAAQPGAAASANIPMGGASQEISGNVPGYVDPMVSAPNSRVAQTPNVEVAQALTAQPSMSDASYFPPAPQAGGLDPAVVQALSDPNASPQNRQLATMLVERQQAQQKAAQEQAQKLALQKQEIARRRSIAQAQGFDPTLAEDEIAYKAAVEAASRGRQTQNVNGKVIDVNTGEVIFDAPQQAPTSVQEYNFYAEQMKANGQQPMDYNSWSLQKAGAGAQTNIGSIPAGMMLERDGASMRLVPIPGGPADMEAKTAATKADAREGGKQTTADTIVQAATRAIAAAEAPGLPATGTIGNIMSNLSESNAAEVRRQVQTLQSVGTLDNMIAAKEQGAAFGGTTQSELELLAARAGTLDPSSPNFIRDAKDYTRALFKGMYGPDEGERKFNEIDWAAMSAGDGKGDKKASAENPLPPQPNGDGWVVVNGVKIRARGGN